MTNFLKDLFTWRGRWNRLKFWIYPFIVSIVFLVLAVPAIFYLVFNYINGYFGLSSILIIIFIIILYLALMWISIIAYIKRLHDLDKTGWLILLFIIPFVNIGLFIYCGFFKGTEGENRFGPNPLEKGNNVNSKNVVKEKIEL